MSRHGIFPVQTPSDWATFFAVLKATGRDFVVRRLEEVTSGELSAANSAGVDHVFVYSPSPIRATEGSAAGTADATAVFVAVTGLLAALGLATSLPVYFGVETDTDGASVLDYFNAIGTYCGGITKIGVLGPWRVCEYLLQNSKVTYACQTMAWSKGRGWHASVKILEYQGGYAIGGITASKLRSLAVAFGQERGGVKEPTAPTTVAMASLAPTIPMGLVIRSGRPDETLMLCIKDESGYEIEYQGRVVDRTGGLAPRYTCEDPSTDWSKIVCRHSFSKETIGVILRSVVENPSGLCPTGIVCHIEEPRGSDNVPIVVENWSGNSKTVLTVIEDFAEATGCRWILVSRDGVWHFYFGHAANWPLWDQLRDDVASDSPGTQRRVVPKRGEIAVGQTRAAFANRVNYPCTIEPPRLPGGLADWDEVWTEDSAKWKLYGNGTTVTGGLPAPGYGDASILFTKSYTIGTGAGQVLEVPGFVDLGYVLVPGPLCDMSSWYWGWLEAQVQVRVTTDQGIPIANIPRSIVNLQVGLHSGAYPGPSFSTVTNATFVLNPSQKCGAIWTNTRWKIYPDAIETRNDNGDVIFDPTNVRWIQLRALLTNPRTITKLTSGKSWALNLWIDHLKPVGTTAVEDAPTTSQSFVEAEAVTNGEEQPIPMTIQDLSLPYQQGEALAELALAEAYRTRTTVPELPVVGMVNPSVLCRFPLQLTSVGVTDVNYGPVAVVHKPFEDRTYISCGDTPLGDDTADATVRRMLDRTRASLT